MKTVILPFGCHSSTELVAAGGVDVEDVGASTAGGAAKEAPGAPQVKAAETSSEPAVEVTATAAVGVAETEAAARLLQTPRRRLRSGGQWGQWGHGA